MTTTAIPNANQIDPLSRPQDSLPLVDETGRLTPTGIAMLREWRDFISGTARVIPCTSSGKNLISLTPVLSAPVPDGYRSYDIFVSRADQTSDAAVTATVVPRSGTLATLKVYKTSGAAQAGAGDIVSGSVYLFVFADHLDSGAGGLIAK